MKKIIILLMLLLAITATASARNELKLIKARGKVDLSVVGGSGLYVFSLWAGNKGASLGPDGSFTTIISSGRPQKISVKDERGMTRALAIALPDDANDIVFDARSTAIAILFQDPSLFSNSAQVKKIVLTMSGKKSFNDLVNYFKDNLPSKSLEELSDNPQCVALVEKCNDEVFGQNQSQIRKDLRDAEYKLQKLLQ